MLGILLKWISKHKLIDNESSIYSKVLTDNKIISDSE